MVSAGWDRIIRIWDVYKGKEIKRLEGHTHRIEILCCSSDGKLIASGGGDGTVRIWSV